jgi:hypothetical protein
MGLWARMRAQLFGDDRPDVGAPTDQATPEPTLPEAETPTEPAQAAEPAEQVRRAEPAEPAAESDAVSVETRQERAAGRLLEDERLRGDLTDEEFQPLLDWALTVTDRVAASTDGLPDTDADAKIDAVVQAVREVLGAAGAAIVAHNEGDTDRRASEIGFLARQGIKSVLSTVPGLAAGSSMTARVRRLSRAMSRQSDLSGAEIAARLARALTIEGRKTGAGP